MENRRGKTGPVWGLEPMGGIWKGGKRLNIVEILWIHMRPVETVSEMGNDVVNENDGKGEFSNDICKNFSKCHNVPQYNINVIIRK
jgi:hypothetical protein